MASKRELKRFIFKLERKLVRERKKLSSKLAKELKRQLNEIIKNDGTFESRTYDILMNAYLEIGMEFADKQFNALTTGDFSKADRFFLDYWKGWIEQFISIRVAEKVKNMDDWSTKRYFEVKQQIKEVIAESPLSIEPSYITEQLHEKLGRGVFSNSRAMTIARTETSAIANLAKAKSAESWADQSEQSGQRQFKMWVHRPSKSPRDNHVFLDGMIIETNESFQVVAENGTTDYMRYPHDENASAENVINCNCQVVYMSEDYMNQLN